MFKGTDLIHSYSFKDQIWSLAIESDYTWLIGGNAKLFTFNTINCLDNSKCNLPTLSYKFNGYVYVIFKTSRGDYAIGTDKG